MSFAPVPEESLSQINKAGEIISGRQGHIPSQISYPEYFRASDLALRWRACHAYPINTFQATLRTKCKVFSSAIVAQRLKRMPTIVDKLRRYPGMQLTRMQDIAGIRAVLNSVDDVKKLSENYVCNANLVHKLKNTKDYISNPRNEDGYRSIHLIYEYRNTRNTAYDGLMIEMQLRTKLQHIWATAVETMGTFLGQALKSRQGEKDWIDFFAITSSAFSFLEKCPPVPRFGHLSKEETFHAVKIAENRLGALERMTGFSAAVDKITNKGTTGFYHVLVLDSLAKVVRIYPYSRDNFDQALAEVQKYEEAASRGEKIEPVLVSAGPLDQLRKAYPNFFLDIGAFNKIVRNILDKSK